MAGIKGRWAVTMWFAAVANSGADEKKTISEETDKQ